MTLYRRVHKQTDEVRIGTWEQICDLDKRVWSEPTTTREFMDSQNLSTKVLAWVPMFNHLVLSDGSYVPSNDTVYKQAIFSINDLVGCYLSQQGV